MKYLLSLSPRFNSTPLALRHSYQYVLFGIDTQEGRHIPTCRSTLYYTLTLSSDWAVSYLFIFLRNGVRLLQFIVIQIRKAISYSFFAPSVLSLTLLGGMLSTSDLTVPNGAGNSPVGEWIPTVSHPVGIYPIWNKRNIVLKQSLLQKWRGNKWRYMTRADMSFVGSISFWGVFSIMLDIF